ncbi:unnamed protein product [Microthlaspi erraticum]|uniref:Uncharacterized protein n=1 Tax=Microthlaspi erraticum TaxID=1685480 RepID=A0A6D2IDY8_9BRAS|nr:unnamed protein product [Microthlaspi erraticum]
MLLTKYERNSSRVYGLSFHPTEPWILAALDTGVIQLWDYRKGTLIDRFEEHEGPVRGVHFHISKSYFVSGGEDGIIRVWNTPSQAPPEVATNARTKQVRKHKKKPVSSLFTLTGHGACIRTVQFHHENPWIVSASDDKSIRIWNWRKKKCISILNGHTEAVMCASAYQSTIVSASLDRTVRVWDTASLASKSVSPPKDIKPMNELRGHDNGVNWVCIHPTLPLIVSGATDGQVKLWRMNAETKAWEEEATLQGHRKNVSSVMFHTKQDMIVSSSKDRSIRVWDDNTRAGIQTHTRVRDGFLILAVHPEIDLLAAGHDNGFMVFRLEKERPIYALTKKEKKNHNEIWWDLENAPVPHHLKSSSHQLYDMIVKKLRQQGFKGSITITAVVAYSDSFRPCLGDDITVVVAKNEPRPKDIVTRNNQAADEKIEELVDEWLEEQRKPGNGFIISGDTGFEKSFVKLNQNGHSSFSIIEKGENDDTPTDITRVVKQYWMWRGDILPLEEKRGVEVKVNAKKRKNDRSFFKSSIDNEKKEKAKEKKLKKEQIKKRKKREEEQ